MSNQVLETVVSRVTSRPRLVPTGDCRGKYIGPINLIYHCWVATGPTRALFYTQLKDSILRLLDGWSASLSSEDFVILSLYMIGRSERSALPTICFISANDRNRKEARAIVKESGLLKGYSLFKTSHMSKDLGWGSELEQLGTSGQAPAAGHSTIPATELYFDRSMTLSSVAMPVYVRHVNTKRAATANVIKIRGRFFYLTVSHVFLGAQPAMISSAETSGIDFEIDSDEETNDVDNMDDMDASTTTHGSLSFQETVNNASPSQKGEGCSHLENPPTVNDALSTSLVAPVLQTLAVTSVKNDRCSRGSSDPNIHDALPPQIDWDKYNLLGVIKKWSIDQDWALIDGPDLDIGLLQRRTIFMSPARMSNTVVIGLPIVAYTSSHGRVEGTVVGTPSFMRIPQGKTFQEVYAVRLQGSLTYGDCGSAVFEAVNQKLVGIVVAGCQPSGVVYIIPANGIVANLEEAALQIELDGPQQTPQRTYIPEYSGSSYSWLSAKPSKDVNPSSIIVEFPNLPDCFPSAPLQAIPGSVDNMPIQVKEMSETAMDHDEVSVTQPRASLGQLMPTLYSLQAQGSQMNDQRQDSHQSYHQPAYEPSYDTSRDSLVQDTPPTLMSVGEALKRPGMLRHHGGATEVQNAAQKGKLETLPRLDESMQVRNVAAIPVTEQPVSMPRQKRYNVRFAAKHTPGIMPSAQKSRQSPPLLLPPPKPDGSAAFSDKPAMQAIQSGLHRSEEQQQSKPHSTEPKPDHCLVCNETWTRPFFNPSVLDSDSPVRSANGFMHIVERLQQHSKDADANYAEWVAFHSQCPHPVIEASPSPSSSVQSSSDGLYLSSDEFMSAPSSRTATPVLEISAKDMDSEEAQYDIRQMERNEREGQDLNLDMDMDMDMDMNTYGKWQSWA